MPELKPAARIQKDVCENWLVQEKQTTDTDNSLGPHLQKHE